MINRRFDSLTIATIRPVFKDLPTFSVPRSVTMTRNNSVVTRGGIRTNVVRQLFVNVSDKFVVSAIVVDSTSKLMRKETSGDWNVPLVKIEVVFVRGHPAINLVQELVASTVKNRVTSRGIYTVLFILFVTALVRVQMFVLRILLRTNRKSTGLATVWCREAPGAKAPMPNPSVRRRES